VHTLGSALLSSLFQHSVFC